MHLLCVQEKKYLTSTTRVKSFLVSGGDFCHCVGSLGALRGLGDVETPPEFAKGFMVDLGQVALYLFVPPPVKWGIQNVDS